jgi:RNA polymerase sigma-70 factor (ECF subfamily)
VSFFDGKTRVFTRDEHRQERFVGGWKAKISQLQKTISSQARRAGHTLLLAELIVARKQNIQRSRSLPSSKASQKLMAPIAKFEDKTLIEMALAGQSEYFSVLMDRHVTAVRRCVMSMVRNTSDVDDLVQDAFLKAWTHLCTFRFEASFRSWITRIAMNESLGLYRRQRCRPSFSAPGNLEAFASQCESPHEALVRSETRLTLHIAIARLPTKYREILTLCDLEQLSAQETAGRLKLSIPLVKTRLFRARRMLSAALHKSARMV